MKPDPPPPHRTDPDPSPPAVILLMGVSGSGKTTVGQLVAARLGCPFVDGDAVHPPANVAKMSQGVPLTDADRQPWLLALRRRMEAVLARGAMAVFTCSALKQQYRDVLLGGLEGVRLVYLQGDYTTIARRLEQRRGHFMPAHLLQSQFAILEPPASALVLDVGPPPEALAASIAAAVGH